MSNNKTTEIDDILLIVQIVKVAGGLGLSMASAMCGTFVAAQLTMTNAALFDSARFIAPMVLIPILGFHLGIAIPHLRASLAKPESDRPRIDPIELLSRIGTCQGLHYLGRVITCLREVAGATSSPPNCGPIANFFTARQVDQTCHHRLRIAWHCKACGCQSSSRPVSSR